MKRDEHELLSALVMGIALFVACFAGALIVTGLICRYLSCY